MATNNKTIFELIPNKGALTVSRGTIWLTGGLLIASWMGINAIWGLTSTGDTMFSGLQKHAMPLQWWVAIVTILLAGNLIFTVVRKQKAFAGMVAMLLAYFIGVLVSRNLYIAANPVAGVPLDEWIDIPRHFWMRSFLLMPAIPMLIVFLFLKGRSAWQVFRWGDWRATTRIFIDEEDTQPWRKQMQRWFLFAFLPLFLLMQSQVNLAPILTGKLFLWLIPLVLMALFNALTEELIFRGFIQSSLVPALGPGLAIWLQGIFFGIHHWGTSPTPSVYYGFFIAVLTAFLGIVWGKSAYETKGLGWAITCHALFDLAFFSAQFVKIR